MTTSAPYLLGRFLDPLFAICVGAMSYYSYEQKVQRPAGHTLDELIRKKYDRLKNKKTEL
uniref:Protein involved in non-classical protein export pathway n=1 Tax=Kluyveromyces marxianus TaxID=4911 RepID=F4NCP0_KLUMA|nr:protein involved in non-classical protein export pathway [Kluyveromyces marxianus]CCA89269.1 protein involved in non-classical protein export pathway [Kluyveromyces marxianus]